MKKTIYTSLWLMLTSAFLFSCCSDEKGVNCPDAKNEVHDLSHDELSKVPYTGYDTLKFLDQDGDTNIVVGTGKQFYYNHETASGVPPDCPQNSTRQHQGCKISFVRIKGDLEFELTQQKIDNLITINRYNYSVEALKKYHLIGRKDLDREYYIDSLVIRNKTYKDVSRFLQRSKSNITVFDTSYVLYYNLTHGILLIKSSKQNEEYSILNQ